MKQIMEEKAQNYKNGKINYVTEKVVKDSTITLTINNEISRNLSAIEDSLEEFAVGYLFNENMVKSLVYKNNFIVKEDVSRHVAVDKVIGYGILHDYDLSNSYVIYSGRMPADMVIKIVRAGIPVLASNAAPAYSGCETAKKGNVTLVGFLRGQRFNVYNNKNRIIF